jgi:hypothetical protein
MIEMDHAISTNPKRTLALLDTLEKLGFNEEAFRRLHHQGTKRPREATITRHRAYCETTSEFQPDGTNARVQQRLVFVLETYRKPDNTRNFIALAEASVREIPF